MNFSEVDETATIFVEWDSFTFIKSVFEILII